jgi:hypothetical protein
MERNPILYVELGLDRLEVRQTIRNQVYEPGFQGTRLVSLCQGFLPNQMGLLFVLK